MIVYVEDLLWIVREAKALDPIVMSIFYWRFWACHSLGKTFEGGIDVEWVGYV